MVHPMSSLAGKRLVIFGCGYVGSAVAQAALAAGARVRGPDAQFRKSRGAARRRPGEGWSRSPTLAAASDYGMPRSPGGPDFVVNTVSVRADPRRLPAVLGVDGMQSILTWAASDGLTPVGTLVYTSSTSVYPQGGGATIAETAEAPGATPNGAIIRESEKLLRSRRRPQVCERKFILRLAGIYGPGPAPPARPVARRAC